jgi:hypothetical protein
LKGHHEAKRRIKGACRIRDLEVTLGHIGRLLPR